MLALLKRNFLLYFRNRSGVFFSLLGALISFILYIIFLQKNLKHSYLNQLHDLHFDTILGSQSFEL